MNKKNYLFYLLVAMGSCAMAEVPIVDYSSDNMISSEESSTMITTASRQFSPPTITSHSVANGSTVSMDMEQRIRKLEGQISNLHRQSLQTKIDELQQHIQKLSGQIDWQNHQVEQLDKQLKDFYQDINRRIDENGFTTKAPSNVTGDNDRTAKGVSSSTGVAQKKPPSIESSVFLKEQQFYQAAIDLLPNKKLESETKLREYLKRYPQGIYRANAHYWLGEINFLQKNFDAAEEEFSTIITKYDKSKRVPDALLKRAIVYQNQGREKKAQEEFHKIIKLYPRSSAAQLAKQQVSKP